MILNQLWCANDQLVYKLAHKICINWIKHTIKITWKHLWNVAKFCVTHSSACELKYAHVWNKTFPGARNNCCQITSMILPCANSYSRHRPRSADRIAELRQYAYNMETVKHSRTATAQNLTHLSTGMFYFWMRCRQTDVAKWFALHFTNQCFFVYIGLQKSCKTIMLHQQINLQTVINHKYHHPHFSEYSMLTRNIIIQGTFLVHTV